MLLYRCKIKTKEKKMLIIGLSSLFMCFLGMIMVFIKDYEEEE